MTIFNHNEPHETTKRAQTKRQKLKKKKTVKQLSATFENVRYMILNYK